MKKSNMNPINIIAVIIFFGFTGLVFPQSSGSVGVVDARSMGMAKTFTSSSYGIDALGKNPANLFRDSSKHVELIIPIPLPDMSTSIGTNFFTLDEYNYFFGVKNKDANGKTIGRVLTISDKNRLKNLFADGGNIFLDESIMFFGISIKPTKSFGTFAFTISDIIAASATFPKGIIDLGLFGNPSNSVYNFNDTQFKAWWLRKYSFSYARELNIFPHIFKSLSAGVSINFIQGFAYAGLDHIGTQLKTDSLNVITGQGDYLANAAFSPNFNVRYNFDKSPKTKNSFSPFPTPAGTGVGLDFGINARISESFSVGFALTDIGKVTWNKNAAEYSTNKAIYLDDLTSKDQRDTLVNHLTGKNSGKYVNSFTTPLATALHLGCALQLSNILLALDYNQGFNNQPSNSKIPRFSIGTEWIPFGSLIELRSGISVGGYDKFNWGAGLGLNFGLLELNFGSPDFQYAFSPNNAKRITIAFDSIWRF
jgi:hypothetical protein